VTWADSALNGTSDLVANDPYEIYLTEPAGYVFTSARVTGAELLANEMVGGLRRLRARSTTGGRATWRVEYRAPTSTF
jgi:hypothetical protein